MYNNRRSTSVADKIKKPRSAWLNNSIRHPLRKLFLKTCGYCGKFTDIGQDAEVDHFYPTSLDLKAEKIFEWDNLVWSCHSCNSMKSNNYPLLNPCNKIDMESLYFHCADGRYLLFSQANNDVKDCFILTNKYSNINKKNNPDHRKCLYNRIIELLKSIKRYKELWDMEIAYHGIKSSKAINKKELYLKYRSMLCDEIKSGNYLFLIEFIIKKFSYDNSYDFPFTFNDLLGESNYYI